MHKEPNSIIAWLVKNKVTANILMLIFFNWWRVYVTVY